MPASSSDRPAATLSTGLYEFTEAQNETIARAGARARQWGVLSFITGVFALIGLVVTLVFRDELIAHGLEPSYTTTFIVALTPVVLTHLIIATLYAKAGASLQAVVKTQGNDVEHLMRSLHKLGTAFLVEFAIGMVAVCVSVALGVQMARENVASETERTAPPQGQDG
ncbi:MAG: hypothetical protein AAGA54_02240 [Myxococcota bacterium]